MTEGTPDNLGLTEVQWERLAYGVAFQLIQTALDNGEETVLDFDEFTPSGYVPPEEGFFEHLSDQVEKIAGMLHDEANKRDG